MNTGFHARRPGGPTAALAATPMTLYLDDYASRYRPSEVAKEDLRGYSRTSVFFERLYERDRQAPVPEAADSDPAMEALDLLLVLQAGWDGRRAQAPSSTAIDLSRVALKAGRTAALAQVRVTPDVEGGVALYFFGGDRMPDGGWSHQGGILVSNEGEVSLYLRNRCSKGADVSDVEAGADGLATAIERIRKFLIGP